MPTLRTMTHLKQESNEIEFHPGTICKKSLSVAEVQDRQERCTADQLARLHQDDAFKQWRRASLRRQWMRHLKAHRSTLLGAATALAAFLLVAVTISLTRFTNMPAANPIVESAGANIGISHVAHAEALQAQLRQISRQLNAATLRANTAEQDQQRQQLSTDRQLKLWNEQTAAEVSREAAARHDAAAQAKQVLTLQQQLQAALQSSKASGQFSESGAFEQMQRQLGEAQRSLADAESRAVNSESLVRAAQRDALTSNLASAALRGESVNTDTHKIPVAPPAWAFQRLAHLKQRNVIRMTALPLWRLVLEIMAAAAAMYGVLQLWLWLPNHLEDWFSTRDEEVDIDAMHSKQQQTRGSPVVPQSTVSPQQTDHASAKLGSFAAVGRIRQAVSNQEAAALAAAQEQIKDLNRDLVGAKAQAKSAGAHAATLQQQLSQARAEVETSTSEGSHLRARQQAFQRQLEKATVREAHLVSKVEHAETLQVKAISNLELSTAKVAAATETLAAQAGQNAEARRALEAKDVELAEVVQQLEELQASLQAERAEKAEAQRAARLAQQRSEAALQRATSAAERLASHQEASERMEVEMQQAAREAEEHAESLSSDKATLARHLAAAQARLIQTQSAATPRQSRSMGRRSDSGHLTGNLISSNLTTLRRQNSAESLASEIDDGAPSVTPNPAGMLQSQLSEARSEIRLLLQRATEAEDSASAAEQARAAAEAATQHATQELRDADRETELLEAQLEQLTDSLRHTSARKQELESELRNFEQKLENGRMEMERSEGGRIHAEEELLTARTAVAGAHDAALRLIVAQEEAEDMLGPKENEMVAAFWEQSAARLTAAATAASTQDASAADWSADDLMEGVEILPPAAQAFVTATLRLLERQRNETRRVLRLHSHQGAVARMPAGQHRLGSGNSSPYASPSIVSSAQVLSTPVRSPSTVAMEWNAAPLPHHSQSSDSQGEAAIGSSDDSLLAAAQHFRGLVQQVSSMQGGHHDGSISPSDGRHNDTWRRHSPLRSPLNPNSQAQGVVDNDAFRAWFGNASSRMRDIQSQLATPLSSGSPSVEGSHASPSGMRRESDSGYATNPLFETAALDGGGPRRQLAGQLAEPPEAAAGGSGSGAAHDVSSQPSRQAPEAAWDSQQATSHRSEDGRKKQEAVGREDVEDDGYSKGRSSRGEGGGAPSRQRSVRRSLVMGPNPTDSSNSSRNGGNNSGPGSEFVSETPRSAHTESTAADGSGDAEDGAQQQVSGADGLPQPVRHNCGGTPADSPRVVGAAKEKDAAAGGALLSSLAAEVAAEEAEETAQEAQDGQALLHSVWTQLNYVMQPADEMREAADRLITSAPLSSAINTQHRDLDQACKDTELADKRTTAAALQKFRQAGVLKALEQQSDQLRGSGSVSSTALERQIESAHLQLAGNQVDLLKAVKARWKHQCRAQGILASLRGYGEDSGHQSHPSHLPHEPHLPHAANDRSQPVADLLRSPGRHSCNASSICGTSIPSSIRSMAGETGLLGLLESPEPSNARLRAAGSFAPRLLGGVVMRSTDAAGATFTTAPTLSTTASSPFAVSLNGLAPSDTDFSLDSINGDDVGLSSSRSTTASTNGLHSSPVPRNASDTT